MDLKAILLSKRCAPSNGSNFGLFYQGMLNTGNATPWSEEERKGRINLSIAENRLNFSTLQQKMSEHPITNANVEISQYGASNGLPRLRDALATHLTHLLGNMTTFHSEGTSISDEDAAAAAAAAAAVADADAAGNHGKDVDGDYYSVDPNHLIITQGVTSALDALGFVLSNPGDVWLTPAPFYVSYTRDLKTRCNVDVWPVRPATTTISSMAMLPTSDDFEAAWNRCQKHGRRVTTVLLCNPGNPTGCCYSAEALCDILAWCKQHNVHCVVDEIFAATSFGSSSPFCSVLTLPTHHRNDRGLLALGPHVTVLWGCAKELGLGGWHLGCILSESQILRDALCRTLRVSGPCSNPVQHQLACVLEDRTFMKAYADSNLEILRRGCKEVMEACDSLGFNYVTAQAGLFVFISMKRLMKEASYANERAVFRHIFQTCNVVMSPGEGSLAPPGFFRCCYGCAPHGAVKEAFRRIASIHKDDIVVTEDDRIGSQRTEELLHLFYSDDCSSMQSGSGSNNRTTKQDVWEEHANKL